MVRVRLFILASVFFAQGAFTMEGPPTLDQVFEKINMGGKVHHILENYQETYPEAFKDLSEQIKADDFFDKASAANMGAMKSRSMLSFCNGTKYESIHRRKPVQKEKLETLKMEMPQLQSIGSEKVIVGYKSYEIFLEKMKKHIWDAAERLGLREEIREKIEVVEENISDAKNTYQAVEISGNELFTKMTKSQIHEDLYNIASNFLNPSVNQNNDIEFHLEILFTALKGNSLTLDTDEDKASLKREVDNIYHIRASAYHFLNLAMNDMVALAPLVREGFNSRLI